MSDPDEPRPRISVVTVSWNCEARLRGLVESMNRHLGGGVELVVVDNASADDPERAASLWRGATRFLQTGENLGYGAAMNRGVAACSGEVAVMINPDTELLDGGIERLAVGALRRNALVGPRVLNGDWTLQPSASGPEVGLWPWVRALVPSRVQPPSLLARTEPYRLTEPVRVSWLTGACVAGPTSALRALGPFDPSLHMFGEDVDLGLRAASRGVESWFDPRSATILHHGQASSTLVYGSSEGWRPTGTLNWRAAVRRAYGPRRELAAWWALRTNLRLRLAAKTLLGTRTARDVSAMRAAASAHPVPELGPPPEPR